MVGSILLFLWGTLFGYLVATFQIAKLLVKKGYRRFDEIPDND
jgi:Sec-independent protein secretion pathway component TatC